MPQPRLGVVGFQPSIDTSYSLGDLASIEAKAGSGSDYRSYCGAEKVSPAEQKVMSEHSVAFATK